MYGNGWKVSGNRNGMYGKGYLQQGKLNHRFGTKASSETRKKMSEKRKGGNNPKAKQVLQFDLNGNLIRSYDYISDVINYGFSYRKVLQCCKRTIYSYDNFIFRFKKRCTIKYPM